MEVSVVSTNLSELVYDIFGELSKESYDKIIYGLNKLPADATPSQILSQIKIYFSIDLFPRFIDTTKITNPLTLLPKLQSTAYDAELIRLINQYIV